MNMFETLTSDQSLDQVVLSSLLFYNVRHKQQIQNKVRVERSLMVEGVYDCTSNSQIYLNDHLTPFMNKLFLVARKAKAAGQLASATS